MLSRALITIGVLKTQVEESRWEKLKAAVGMSRRQYGIDACDSDSNTNTGALGVLALLIMVSMEVYVVQPKAAKKRSEPTSPPPQPDIVPASGNPWIL